MTLVKKYLPEVTLVSTASVRLPEHIVSIEKCCQEIQFGKVIFISHELPENLPDYVEFKQYKKIENIMDYNQLVFLDLGDFIETSHTLLCQDHAYILNPDLWEDEWLSWDYCGAIWPIKENSYIGNNGDIVRNGNGGFSLRSKKLMDLPKQMGWYLKQEQGFYNEDGNTCCYWRKEMLENGIKYAPPEIAAKFSYETPVPENNWGARKTFGFHKNLPHIYSDFERVVTLNDNK